MYFRIEEPFHLLPELKREKESTGIGDRETPETCAPAETKMHLSCGSVSLSSVVYCTTYSVPSERIANAVSDGEHRDRIRNDTVPTVEVI
jgi:hypothetical protein